MITATAPGMAASVNPVLTSVLPTDSSRSGARPSLGGSTDQSDVISAFLEPCRFRCTAVDTVRLSSPWGFEFRRGLRGFVLVCEGTCLFEPQGTADALALRMGDFLISNQETTILLRDRAGSATVPVDDLRNVPSRGLGAEHHGGAGAECRIAWGQLEFEDEYSQQAFAMLPAALRLPSYPAHGDAAEPALVRSLREELAHRRPGANLVIRCLVQALLAQALRERPPELPGADAGLFSALRVPGLGAVLARIHAEPEHDWSVRELADIAGLSRAAFAVRFVEALGRPPFTYLRDVRMHLACRRLRDSEQGVKEIAAGVGYATEASFSKAFVRWCKTSPGEYRRQSRNGG